MAHAQANENKLEKVGPTFSSSVREGCFNLFISQRLFDSCIKNRSMVITEDLLAFFKNCLPLEFSCTWIYSVLSSVAILLAAAEREKTTVTPQ